MQALVLVCKNNPTLSPFGAEKHPLSFSLTYAAAGLLRYVGVFKTDGKNQSESCSYRKVKHLTLRMVPHMLGWP